MHTPRFLKLGSLALLSASLFLSSNAFADAASRAKLVAERDTILVSFLKEAESRYQSGAGTDEQIDQAKHALYAFRRDSATKQEDRISNQELIVQLIGKQVLKEKARHEAGLGTELSMLKIKDQLLEAQILLEDLRAGVTHH